MWTDDQVLRLLDSLEHGYHVGSLILWDRAASELPEKSTIGGLEFARGTRGWGGYIVIGGQQRLGALVKAYLSGRFAYDCDLRRVVIDQPPAPHLFPLSYLSPTRSLLEAIAWAESTENGLWKLAYLEETFRDRYISAVRIPSAWTLDKVLESYRRVNTEGTPMDPGDLAAGLARMENFRG